MAVPRWHPTTPPLSPLAAGASKSRTGQCFVRYVIRLFFSVGPSLIGRGVMVRILQSFFTTDLARTLKMTGSLPFLFDKRAVG